MKTTGVIYKGEKQSVDILYDRYMERIRNEESIDIISEMDNKGFTHNMGILTNVFKDGNTLIGEFELRLDKYINLKPNIIRSRLKGEDFVRTFKVRNEH